MLSVKRAVVAIVVVGALTWFFIVLSRAEERPANSHPVATATVSPGGTGSTCSAAAPCGSLVSAMARVGNGGHVVMTRGRYSAQSLGRQPAMAAFTRNVVISPAPGARVTLASLWVSAPHVTIRGIDIAGGDIVIDSSHVRLDHLTIDGQDIDGGPPAVHQLAAINVIGRVSDVTVSNTMMRGLVDRDGINVGDGSLAQSHLTFIDNTVLGAREASLKHHTDCFQVFGGQSGVTLRRNTFVNCSNSAVFLQAATAPVRRVTVTDNILVPCSTPGQGVCGFYTIYVQGVKKNRISGVTMTHNTILGNVAFTTHPDRFTANILTGGYGYNVCGGGWEAHNLIGVPPQVHYCPQGDIGTGDVSGTPLFVNPAKLDFSLRSDSPGQGKGARR